MYGTDNDEIVGGAGGDYLSGGLGDDEFDGGLGTVCGSDGAELRQ